MIFLILSLVLTPLSTQNFHFEDREWEGKTHSTTNSVEVIGTSSHQNKPTAPQKNSAAPSAPQESVATPKPSDEVIMEGAERGIDRFFRKAENELVTVKELASLNIGGGHISMQPARGWAYVNKPVYLQSNTTPLTKETTILGTSVTITATPVSYTWHLGDGHSFTTKDGGGQWPNGTVTYSYTRSGTYTLSVDITWSATYTVNGRTYPVNGTLTTTSTGHTIKIVEAEAVLTY